MDGRMFNPFRVLEESIINSQMDTSRQQKSKLVGGTVCKYWLENRCKKGENCEYLHENIADKLPECPSGLHCNRGKDCPFKHTPKQIKECQNYSNGHCKEGKACKSAHIKKFLCLNYLLGFCPSGPNCNYFHFKTLINPLQDDFNHLLKK
jgi:cleavage and polyadenylation specificity factor subunit 4